MYINLKYYVDFIIVNWCAMGLAYDLASKKFYILSSIIYINKY